MSLAILTLIGGIFLLVYSSDWFIQGCVKLSKSFRVSPFFVGLIFVAFGTSIPEAGVGIIAALKNQRAIALGNIIGSNISNIGLILGLCALLLPLAVNRGIFRWEMPVMLFSASLLYLLSLDLIISRFDGLLLLICFAVFFLLSYKNARRVSAGDSVNNFKFGRLISRISFPPAIIGITILSLTGIILGANLMIKGGVVLAAIFGVTPWLVSITVFAAGTSLPELSASIAASFRKVPSISLGNIVGSNIFNVLFVLGVVALIRPVSIAASLLSFEFPALIVFSFLLFTVMRTGYKITRFEGVVLFAGYVIFIFVLLARAGFSTRF